MSEQKHILLRGARGAGKSTLLRRLCEASGLPLYGFVTKRLPSDETGFHPIYLNPAGETPRYEAFNRIGSCDSKVHHTDCRVFDTLGTAYIEQARPDGLIVMDELGFMEAQAQVFTAAVLKALDGDIPVLAAIKDRDDVPFLNALRAHPRAAVYELDESRRESLYQQLLPLVLAFGRREG